MSTREGVKTRQTVNVTRDEMDRRIARFNLLRPQSVYHNEAEIPRKAYEMVSAKTLYTLMAPSTRAGPMSASPAVVSDDKLSVIIAECPPGDKPMLHVHFHTTEHFFCLTGRFKVRWGDEGESETILEPFDMIAVPKGVCRDFTNIADGPAYLLVFITGGSEDDYSDIAFTPSESKRFKDEFGDHVAAKLESIGFSFMDEKST